MPIMPNSGYFNVFDQTFTEAPTEPSAAHIFQYVPKADVPQDAIFDLIKDIGNKSALGSVQSAHLGSKRDNLPCLSLKEYQECFEMIIGYCYSSAKLRANIEQFKIPYGDVDLMRRVLDCVRNAVSKKG